MKLYENIRNLRIENGWSQQELADRTGYTDRSSIAKIEKGQVDLSQSKIALFAKVFGVDPVDLMGFENSDDIKAEINRLFEKLTPAKQEAVLAFLRQIVQ